MMGSSPPSEDQKLVIISKKSPTSNTKSVKPQHRAPKRAGSAASVHQHDHLTHRSGVGRGHKRVWKACERCRMKKTKCDGEFPCNRCKNDGLVCTAGVRKKIAFKQLPRGYAEVLENTQFALIATVHKLYNMVRSGEQWHLGEPELNDRGLPIIHDIASKLGAIRSNSDIDLPAHSVFPEEAGMTELARQLEERLPHQETVPMSLLHKDSDSTASSTNSPELDHSDDGELDMNYRRLAFVGGNPATGMSSPASLTHSLDFENTPSSGFEISSFNLFSNQAQTGTFSPPMWPEVMPRQSPEPPTLTPRQTARVRQLQRQQEQMQQQNIAFMRNQIMGSNMGGMKLQGLSHPNSDPMISMGDPMICHGFDVNDQRA